MTFSPPHDMAWDQSQASMMTGWWLLDLLHHQDLLLLVQHRASMKSFQALRSPAIPLTSFHVFPVPLISSSIVLCHVLLGLPLRLYPWGFQSNAVFSTAPIYWTYLIYEINCFLKAHSQKVPLSKKPYLRIQITDYGIHPPHPQIWTAHVLTYQLQMLPYIPIHWQPEVHFPISLTSELINLNMKVRESHQ